MPITNLLWGPSQGFDTHILRNNQSSMRLDETLFVVEEIGTNNNKLEFKSFRDIRFGNVQPPQEYRGIFFLPSWEQRATRNPPIYEWNGIRVNILTGEITAVLQAAPQITSFLLRAVLMVDTGQPDPVPFQVTPLIMVHIHEKITEAWVTPSLLSVRPDVVKGISSLELRLISNKPVQNMVWRSDNTFTKDIDQFLLNNFNPFNLSSFPVNHVFVLPSPVLFDNRRHFPDNQVFTIPIHLEIHYVNQQDPVQVTVPTHLSHLMQTGQIIDDGAGNDLFEVVRIEEKAQYRASIYATFDDGTMGDITFNHGITWDREAGVPITDIDFEGDGSFRVHQGAVGKTLGIRAILPQSLVQPGLTEVTGEVKVEESWLNANPVARPVPGSPTHLSSDDVPNVLFISEGFEEEAAFRRVVQNLCGKLRTDTKTTPWNHLFSNAMNAWMLFEKSEETAASILNESVLFEEVLLQDGSREDVALPLIDLLRLGNSRLDAGGGLDLNKLISMVGLPLPADTTANLNDKLTEWRQLFDPNFGNGPLQVHESVFDFWKRLANRRLVEERNTVFGMSCGEKPKITPLFSSDIISFNFRSRLNRNNIDLLLSRIRANSATGDRIGEKYWARDASGKFGKDYGLIVFLVGGLRKIGSRFTDKFFPEGQTNTGIGAGIVDDHVSLTFLSDKLEINYPFFFWKTSPGSSAFEIVPFDVPTDLAISTNATVAHELAHSFNLGDEYATPGKLNVFQGIQVNHFHNLQLHDDLLDGGQISGDKIKWRWPRIKKAGILQNSPAVNDPVPNNITVELIPGHEKQFTVDEVVHLRQRDIINTSLSNLMSPKLTVLNKPGNNKLVLQPVSNGTFNWAGFGKGSLLILPVKAPSEDRNNPTNDEYAEVLSPIIRDWINDNHKPMTKFPCAEEDLKDIQDPVNLPSLLGRPGNRRLIIGLYSGGHEFSCGIYHPSGECIMRKEAKLEKIRIEEVIRESNRVIYPFCHICRYSLVDQIDPTQHQKIDKNYESVYPKKDSLLLLILKIAGVIALIALIGYGIYKYSKKNDS